MTEQRSIFRREALEHRARSTGPGPGDVVRAAPWWTSWAFFALVALVVAALVAGSLVTVDRYARGPATTDGRGRVVVLLPVALAPKVAPGSRVEVGGVTGEVVSSEEGVLQPGEARRTYGLDVITPSVVVVTSASGVQQGSVGRVLVESGPVLTQFVPGLGSLLGGNDR